MRSKNFSFFAVKYLFQPVLRKDEYQESQKPITSLNAKNSFSISNLHYDIIYIKGRQAKDIPEEKLALHF